MFSIVIHVFQFAQLVLMAGCVMKHVTAKDRFHVIVIQEAVQMDVMATTPELGAIY